MCSGGVTPRSISASRRFGPGCWRGRGSGRGSGPGCCIRIPAREAIPPNNHPTRHPPKTDLQNRPPENSDPKTDPRNNQNRLKTMHLCTNLNFKSTFHKVPEPEDTASVHKFVFLGFETARLSSSPRFQESKIAHLCTNPHFEVTWPRAC